MRNTLSRGFTMIEILLVIALISVVSGLGLRLPYLFAPEQMHEADMFAVVTAMYRAQTLAAAGRDDNDWGVRVSADDVTVFRGESYDERDETVDELLTLESDIVLTGAEEVLFRKGSGTPAEAATVSLRFGTQEGFVTVSEYGVIDYRYAF